MSDKFRRSPIDTETLINNIRRGHKHSVDHVILGEREVVALIDGCRVQIPHVIDKNWFHGSPNPFPLKSCPDWLVWSAAWWNFHGPCNDDPRQEGVLWVEVGDYIVKARYERLCVGEKPYQPFRLAEIVGANRRDDERVRFLYEAWETPFRYIPPDRRKSG